MAAHIVIGVLILAVGVVLISLSGEFKRPLITRSSIHGLIFVASAIANGLIFALKGQNNNFSIGMAMSFLIVYIVYFAEFYFIGRIQTAYDCNQQNR